jgi:hypothetical protein
VPRDVPREACRRLLLAEGLHEEVAAHVRLGLISATIAREVGRLPQPGGGGASDRAPGADQPAGAAARRPAGRGAR